ncbi:MAG: hypothetical protein HYY23_09970 [Verrucomicrobia bacterium]|nr:hypothetical protein [Verrucomicrobiota bacterium]
MRPKNLPENPDRDQESVLPLPEGEGRGEGEGGAGDSTTTSFRAAPSLNRRMFLKSGTWSVAALGVTGAGVAIAEYVSRRNRLAASGAGDNPFAYDLTHLTKTDPSLIHYKEVARFSCPRAEPKRIALNHDNQVFVAAGNYISVMDRNGGVISEIALTAPARALALASDGLIYASLRDHIEVFAPKGQRLASWTSPGPRTWLSGLATSESELFAADAGHRVVLRYDRSGKLLGRIGEKSRERDIPGFVVPSPFFDLELARDGLLRITNPGRHRVEAYTIDGDFEFAWGKASAAIEGFCGCCNPISVLLLSDGRCVTCEKGLPRVKVYTADGALESVVAGTETFPENARVSAKDEAEGTHGGLDAAVDSEGRIYILDTVAKDIRVMAKKSTDTSTSA